jgi:hypothetical protein
MDLILHLKHCYFEQVANGTKRREYRRVKPYWAKRLEGRTYDRVIICDGFKPMGMHTTRTFAWNGYERTIITHPHFGPDPVEVFAIKLSAN